jgi:hypothetical protein
MSGRPIRSDRETRCFLKCDCFEDIYKLKSVLEIEKVRLLITTLLKNIDSHLAYNETALHFIQACTARDAVAQFHAHITNLKYDLIINGAIFIQFPYKHIFSETYVYLMKSISDVIATYIENFYEPNTRIPLTILKYILELHLELVIILEQYQNLKEMNFVHPIINEKSIRCNCLIYFSNQ